MKYQVKVNGKVYEIEVEVGNAVITNESVAPAAAPAAAAPVAAAPAPAPAPAAAPAGAGTAVNAPLPGTVLSVKVANGQAVKAGDILVIIEAMKMENEIVAPCDGTVSSVSVSNGQSVESGTPLVYIA